MTAVLAAFGEPELLSASRREPLEPGRSTVVLRGTVASRRAHRQRRQRRRRAPYDPDGGQHPHAGRPPGCAGSNYSGSPKVNTTLPAAMVTYCCPSTA